MERVAFLVDGTGERIDCLLNPETLEVQRLAGIRTQGTADGHLPGAGRRDDSLLFTGGGRTELRLDLVFDLDLTDSAPASATADVRALTCRLWTLAENSPAGGGRPPLVRLVWGKSWNVPGVVASIAERFDAFGPDGVPRRSWLRLKLVRAGEATEPPVDDLALEPRPGSTVVAAAPSVSAVQVVGAGQPAEHQPAQRTPVRFDLLAATALGDPQNWRALAEHNDIDHPFDVPAGTILTAPTATEPWRQS
jgi:hypothetical protein